MRQTIVVLSLLSLSACASSTGIVPMGQDTYMVSHGGGSAFTSTGAMKAECIQEAAEYCSKNSKVFQVTHTQESPAWPGHFATAEVQFMCLSPGDPELTRPKMRADPTQVIEIRK